MAFKNLRVFEGVPEEYKDAEKMNIAKVKMDRPVKRVKIGELSNILKYRKV